MHFYQLFSHNVQIQYKGRFLSKAMLFILTTTVLNIILPFIVAYRSRGFWLRSYSFYEQPKVHFTYEYLLVAETEDPSRSIVCGEAAFLAEDILSAEENCPELLVHEYDTNRDGVNDVLDFKFRLIVPPDNTIASISVILVLDYQLKTVCPLHMQSMAYVTKEFAVPPSSYKYFGDVQLYQTAHLPCEWNVLNNKYNTSLLGYQNDDKVNIVDSMLEKYFRRDVITRTKTIFSRNQNGHTGTMDIKINLRLPESQIRYTPSLMQELKWAWPQYLSLLLIFYWIFERIKRFVFRNRLLMAWKIVPWKVEYKK